MSATFKSNLPAVTAAIETAGRTAMIGGVERMRGMVVKNLKRQGHGKIYPLPGVKGAGQMERAEFSGYAASGTLSNVPKKLQGKFYVASARGEFPAVRLGGLSGPGGVETETESRSDAWEARIGSRLKYGLFLEKKPASKGGRPWLKRTLDENKDAILQGFTDEFNRAMTKAGA